MDSGLVERVFRLEDHEEPPPSLDLGRVDLRHIRQGWRLLRRRIVPLSERYILKLNRRLLKSHQRMKGVLPHLCGLFVERILPYASELGLGGGDGEAPHSGELLFSGFQNFYGLVLIGICMGAFPSEEEMDLMFDYILLYLYVDHYLDDYQQQPQQKAATLKAMFQLVRDPDSREPPARMHGLVEAYRRILKAAPEAHSRLTLVFETEVVGTIFQRMLGDSAPGRQEYLVMCELKGARTALGAHAILYGDDPRWRLDMYRIGACVQLLDDMHDVDIDRQAQIHTIATHDVDRLGGLDLLMYYTLERIESISNKFNLVKTLLAHLATYIVDASPYISRRFKVQLEPLIHIRHSQGVDLVAMFEQWLRELVGTLLRKICTP